jgi:hypothetical protein
MDHLRGLPGQALGDDVGTIIEFIGDLKDPAANFCSVSILLAVDLLTPACSATSFKLAFLGFI